LVSSCQSLGRAIGRPFQMTSIEILEKINFSRRKN
jgi:hypothetical protein